ncbi:MAG: tetratricopeptide repeat protein [Pseudomonadota bacterium]
MLGLGAASAQESADVDTMLSELANPETSNWRQLERRIETAWSKSGSASMDLLLQRAQDAMADEEWDTALEHLTALTDHAPDFAEGWHARATVFFHKKLYGPAIDDIGRALALNPNHYNALTGLAVMFEEMGLGPQALEIYRMVQQMHPHRPEIGQALIRLEAAHGGTTL